MKKLAVLLVLAVVGYFVLDWYLDKKAEEEVDRTIKELNLQGDYEEVDYAPLKNEILIKNLRLRDSEGELFAREVVVREFSEGNIDLEYKDLEVGGDDKLSEDFRGLGYERVRFNGGLKLKVYEEQGVLELKRAYLKLHEGFELNLSLKLTNIDTEFWKNMDKETETNPFFLIGQLSDIRLSSMEFTFLDMGIKERILRREAREKGLPYEEYREEVLGRINRDIIRSKSELEREFLQNLKNFIADGKSVKITANPERGVSFGKLFTLFMFAKEGDGLSRAIRLLNLKLEVR